MASAAHHIFSKAWVFTLWDVEKTSELIAFMETDALVNYGILQGEVCPDTGRPHVQGYFECMYSSYKRGVKALQLWKKFQAMGITGSTLRLTKALGSGASNRTYCSKSDSHDPHIWERYEFDPSGEGPLFEGPAGQGRRSDLSAVHAMVKAGSSLALIADAHPGDALRYHAGIEAVRRSIASDRLPDFDIPFELVYCFGDSGAGKTVYAQQECFPDHPPVAVSQDLSDYAQFGSPSSIFLDEFTGAIPWNLFCRLFDSNYARKPQTLPQRYHNCIFLARKIVVCSNSPPWMQYRDLISKEPQKRIAFWRRFTKILYFEGQYPHRVIYPMPTWTHGAEIPLAWTLGVPLEDLPNSMHLDGCLPLTQSYDDEIVID